MEKRLCLRSSLISVLSSEHRERVVKIFFADR